MALNRDESKAAMGQGPKGRTRTTRPPRGNFNEPSPPPPRRAMTLAELNDAAAAPTRKVRANVSPRAATARRGSAPRNAPARQGSDATVESVVAAATGQATAKAPAQAPAAETVKAPA
ncbi:MAG: ribonuclease E/G, partial [Paeniglutamicibacter sp.]